MNDSIRHADYGGPAARSANRGRHHRPAVLVLLAAACGGGPSSSRFRRPQQRGRASRASHVDSHDGRLLPVHALPRGAELPRPQRATGRMPKVTRAASRGKQISQFQAAQKACAHLLPNGGRRTAQIPGGS